MSELDLDELEQRYTAEPVPPCRICGDVLSIASMGGGKPTEWACSLQEDDPERPGMLRMKPGRDGLLNEFGPGGHYHDSHWTQYRRGDPDVLALIAELRQARADRDHTVPLINALLRLEALGALDYCSCLREKGIDFTCAFCNAKQAITNCRVALKGIQP